MSPKIGLGGAGGALPYYPLLRSLYMRARKQSQWGPCATCATHARLSDRQSKTGSSATCAIPSSWPQCRRTTVTPIPATSRSGFLRLPALLCGRSVCIADLLPNFWHHSHIFVSRAESNTARGSVLTVEQPRLPSGPLHCSASEPGSSKLPGNHRSRCSCRRRPDWLSARWRRQHPSPRTSSLPRLAPRPLCGNQLGAL
jgi:hypothetical protein